MRLPNGSILGQFSKGIEGSISINFGLSGGPNCDDSCQHKDSTCYAQRVENRPDRSTLTAKLARHQNKPPALICGQAILEIQRLLRLGKSIPWLRISTNGSLPQPAQVREDRLFRSQFRALLSLCYAESIPVHCPVESYAKARFYRALVGDLATIRESTQSAKRFLAARGPVSFVVGGEGYRARIKNSRQVAKDRFETSGRKCIVCPAVVNSFQVKLKQADHNPRAHCGACTSCANDNIDIVYPLH